MLATDMNKDLDGGRQHKPEDGSGPLGGLTRIHGRIHCVATEQVETLSETDRLQLKHFFEVLADVALSVARRRLTGHQVIETCEQ